MLRRELGEGPFWRAVQTYARENRGRTVVTEDLRRAIENATGRNLDWFFDQWVFGAGYPELKVSWTHDADQQSLAVTISQKQKGDDATADAFRFHADIEVRAQDRSVTRERVEITRREHTFHFPCAESPSLVLFDPEGDVLASVEVDQPSAAHRLTLSSELPVITRIRAAKQLAEDPSSDSLTALEVAVSTSFWGVAAQAAKALGSTRHPRAREALVRALETVEHPKARRAVAAALGSFRHDVEAGAALTRVLENGDPSYFVEAAAAEALGGTRVPGARETLERALETKDAWAETVRIGCVKGLAALGTPDVLPTLLSWGAYGRHMRLRVAVASALATVGRRMTAREPVLEALGDYLAERDFRMVMASIAALRALGDERGIALLGQAPVAHPDGRVRRSARVAAARLRKNAERTTEVARLADDVEAMRDITAKLLSRIERLENERRP